MSGRNDDGNEFGLLSPTAPSCRPFSPNSPPNNSRCSNYSACSPPPTRSRPNQRDNPCETCGTSDIAGYIASTWSDPPTCLLYTSDAADDLLCVDLGGRRIIK